MACQQQKAEMGDATNMVNVFAGELLKKAEEHLENVEICVYEKNRDVGGTWLENRSVYSSPELVERRPG